MQLQAARPGPGRDHKGAALSPLPRRCSFWEGSSVVGGVKWGHFPTRPRKAQARAKKIMPAPMESKSITICVVGSKSPPPIDDPGRSAGERTRTATRLCTREA